MAQKRHRGDPFEVSGRVMADALGVTIRRVQQIAVRTGHDRYDLVATMQRIRDMEESNGSGDGSIAEARRRYWSARAEREELEVGEKRGKLISSDWFSAFFESLAVTFRSRLLHLPRRAALEIAPDDPRRAERILSTEIHAALEELAANHTLEEVLNRSVEDAASKGA